MSGSSQEKLEINASVIEDSRKRVAGVRKRMLALSNCVSVRKGKDAHELIEKSMSRIQNGIAKMEAEFKLQGVRQRTPARAIIAGLAFAHTILDSANDAILSGDFTKEEAARVAKEVSDTMAQVRVMVNADTRIKGTVQTDAADHFLEEAARKIKPKAKPYTPTPNHPNLLKQVDPNKLTEEQKEAQRVREANERNRAVRDVSDEEQRDEEKKAQHYDAIQQLFRGNKAHIGRLPNAKLTEDPFRLMRLPVFPQIEGGATKEQWKQAGMKVGGTAGGMYVQLDDQIVIAINTEQLKEHGQRMTPAKRALEVIKALSRKRNQTFHAVGADSTSDISDAGRMTRHSQGFVYYWVLTEREISKINRVFGHHGGSFAVSDWGLALPNK